MVESDVVNENIYIDFDSDFASCLEDSSFGDTTTTTSVALVGDLKNADNILVVNEDMNSTGIFLSHVRVQEEEQQQQHLSDVFDSTCEPTRLKDLYDTDLEMTESTMETSTNSNTTSRIEETTKEYTTNLIDLPLPFHECTPERTAPIIGKKGFLTFSGNFLSYHLPNIAHFKCTISFDTRSSSIISRHSRQDE
jgi:hypothetical protein